MKKSYKRILSLVLAIAMCFMFTGNNLAFAQETKKNDLLTNEPSIMEYDSDREDDEIWEIYDEIDGVKYYFKDTPEYTINIIENENVNVYIKDKSKDTLKVYEKKFDVIAQKSTLNNIKTDSLNLSNELSDEDIAQYISTCKLKEEYDVNEFQAKGHRASEQEIARRIDKKLAQVHGGSPYSNKFIDSMREQGKYAKLYESKRFERYKYHNWWLTAGTAIGVVATIVSWPASTIAAICATYTTATGVISIAKDFTSYEYVANVHWNKEVKVGSIYPYRAGKTIKGRILLGDKDAAYRQGKTSKHSDFDNNKSLMRTGIKNYI